METQTPHAMKWLGTSHLCHRGVETMGLTKRCGAAVIHDLRDVRWDGVQYSGLNSRKTTGGQEKKSGKTKSTWKM